MTSPQGFGLVDATPVQRAIFRAGDGEPIDELWENSADVREAFGHAKPRAGVAPDMMMILASIRSAKSMYCAAKAIQVSQTVDLSHVSAGDEIRIPVLATSVDLAHVVFSHIVGNLLASPLLKTLIIGEPGVDSLFVRHPSGTPIEIKVTALAKYASTLIGRWLPAAIFDEAPRMASSIDGVRNLDDSLTAIAGRMLGPVFLIGSPWAPFGVVYDKFRAHFGKEGASCLVVRGRGPQMNPSYWTTKRVADLRRKNPKAAKTDVDAEFADAEDAFFPSALLELAMRTTPGDVAPMPGVRYVAAMDPATRANAWTLVVWGNYGPCTHDPLKHKYRVAFAKQWLGSSVAPLKPREVLREIVTVASRYGVDDIYTDQYSFDALADLANELGAALVLDNMDATERLNAYETVRHLLQEGQLELPCDPLFRTDMLGVTRRLTTNGATVHLKRTADGRHCDFAPPNALIARRLPEAPALEAPRAARDPELERLRQRYTPRDDAWSNTVRRLTAC